MFLLKKIIIFPVGIRHCSEHYKILAPLSDDRIHYAFSYRICSENK